MGFAWEDPRDINAIFERELGSYTGAKHVILTDCCTNAIFLVLQYALKTGKLQHQDCIRLPSRTYVSVPMALHHAGLRFRLEDYEWSGEYELGSTGIFDSAARFTGGMARVDSWAQCLSFQIKKRLPIGRGGAILTDDDALAEWARLAAYDGRNLSSKYDSPAHVLQLGWHFYMTPEDAARGLLILKDMKESYEDMMDSNHYPSLRQWNIISSLEVGDE